MDDIQADLELDLSGLTCPMPLLKTKQALNRMQSGQVVKVQATDPGSEQDFHLFARQSGNALLGFEVVDDHYLYWLRKD